MKAKNIVGKKYVSPMPIKGILKHFIEAFKLQFICLLGGGPNLGATRPRVGIANLGFDAPSWQYLKY